MTKVYLDNEFFGIVLFRLEDYFTLRELSEMGLAPNHIIITTDGNEFFNGWGKNRPKLNELLKTIKKKYKHFWLIHEDDASYKFVYESDKKSRTMETE